MKGILNFKEISNFKWEKSKHNSLKTMAWHLFSAKPFKKMITDMPNLNLSRLLVPQWCINTLKLRQNGCHFPNNILKSIFLNENIWISIKISLNFVPNGPINKPPALVQRMAWHRPGTKPLSEPIMVSLLTHLCVTWPQWVNMTVICVITQSGNGMPIICNCPLLYGGHVPVWSCLN